MNNWIKTSDQMPEPGAVVLACVSSVNNSGKAVREIIRAVWISKFFEPDEDNFCGDSEYNEDNDKYYWPEGWYEWNSGDETHWRMHNEITYWTPLPNFPKELTLTTKELLEQYNFAPYDIFEIAEIVENVTDDKELAIEAKTLLEAQRKFKSSLDSIGFEFG